MNYNILVGWICVRKGGINEVKGGAAKTEMKIFKGVDMCVQNNSNVKRISWILLYDYMHKKIMLVLRENIKIGSRRLKVNNDENGVCID